MPFILIKNNLKLMLRSKWILILMILLPLITIALISSAFTQILKTDYSVGKFEIGYSILKDSSYKEMIPSLKAQLQNNDITLQEYSAKKRNTLIEHDMVDVFVEIKDQSYQIYQLKDKKQQAAVTERILSSFFYKIAEMKTQMEYMAKENVAKGNLESGNVEEKENDSLLKMEQIKLDPLPSSIDYYGIIYIIYFAWCGMVSLAAVISSERKSQIYKRMQLSGMSKTKQYLGKFIPCSIAIAFETCSAWALSVIFLDIHWGNLFFSAVILILIAFASSAFGMVLFHLFKNAAISIIVGFVILWINGFFGGSFQTYIYSHLPQIGVDISPIYYANRTLVEYETMGHSAYTIKCIIYLVGIIIIFSGIGIQMMNKRGKES